MDAVGLEVKRQLLALGVASSALMACEPSPDPASVATSSASPAPPSAASSQGDAPAAAASASASVDATSGASAPVAEPRNVVTGGTVDGKALRALNVARLSKDQSPVTVLRAGSGDQTAVDLGRRLCEAVVPKRPPKTPVMLKPNLCGFDALRNAKANGGDNGVSGRTTDPEFVRGVIHCLKARGHDAITIAEGCAVPHKQFLKVAEVSGYRAMAAEEKVALVAMDDDGVFDVEGDKPGLPLGITGIEDSHVPTLLMPKVLAEHIEHGMWLSLPKIKAHRFSVVSVGIKGMQGVVMLSDATPTHRQKWRNHKELLGYIKGKKGAKENRKQYVDALNVFADRVIDVLEIAAPDAVLAEGLPAMGGDGFKEMRPVADQVAIGGTNTVTVSKVAAQFLGLYDSDKLALGLRGLKTSPLITRAAKRYGLDLDAVTLTGDGADLVTAPRPVHFTSIAPFSVHQP